MLPTTSLLALLLSGTCVVGSLVDDLVYGLDGAVDCSGCHALLWPLQGLAYLGDGVFSDTIIAVCEVLRVSPDVLRQTKQIQTRAFGRLKTRMFVEAQSANKVPFSPTA